MRFAAIDQGTTSTRALVVETSGAVRMVQSIEHKQYYPNPGWVEHDPEELIANIQSCANAVGTVAALGIDNQGESCLAWDSVTKAPLSRVIVWQDRRTTTTVEMLARQGGEAITLARAGLPLDPYFSATKLAWILAHIPAAQAAHAKGRLRLGTSDAFFLDRLTGHFVTDASTASRTSLMNIETLQWDPSLCDLFGVPIEVLPKITTTTGDFGEIDTVNGPVPVAASVVDQQAALYGFGCRSSGESKITFGTGAFALMVTGEGIQHAPDTGLLPTVAWHLEGEKPVFALDGGVYTASAALNWGKSIGLFDDFSEINEFSNPAAIDRNLVFVPALSGLGCPHWRPGARGTWQGIALEHGPQDMVQSILEGVAFRAAEVINAMHETQRQAAPKTAIWIDGGMAQNAYFTQFLADVLFCDVRPAKMRERTGFGTAKLAAQSIGIVLPERNDFSVVSPQTDRRGQLARFQKACDLSLCWDLNGDK